MQEEKISINNAIPRRTFLGLLKKFIIVIVFGWFVYPMLKFLIPPAESGIDPNVLTLAAGEVPNGGSKTLKYRGKAIIVVNTDNNIHALSAVCTHLGCIVKWDQAMGKLVCPCHKAVYDLQGNVLSGPAPKPLFTLEAELLLDKILIKKA